jgi:ABC-type lipoprotein release transport system permease subunit
MKNMFAKFWIKTAFLFLFRSKRSTVVLGLMVVSAVAALVFLSSLAVGINDTMIRNSVTLYSGHISGLNLPRYIKKDDLIVNGVTGVLKRISIPSLLTTQNRSEAINLIAINPVNEIKHTALSKKVIKGHYPSQGEKAVLLGNLLAERLNLQVGNKLRFTGGSRADHYELIIAGIFRTGIDLLDRTIGFCPFGAVSFKTNNWSAAIFLKEGVDPNEIIATYRKKWPIVQQFKSWSELMPDLRQLIDLNYFSMGLVMVLVFGVVSMGISCGFVIFIFRYLREYGIMKAMGVTPREISFLIFIEVILMNLAAVCIGVILGVTLVSIVKSTGIDLTYFTSHNRYFAVSGIVFPRLTLPSLGFPPALALFFSLTATIWPIILLVRKKAADILRII